MLINMQLLPLKTFLALYGLRSALFLAACGGEAGVLSHPALRSCAEPAAAPGARSGRFVPVGNFLLG